MPGPWSFDESVSACSAASQRQRQVEDDLRHAYAAFARAEEAYRLALAQEIVRQHSQDGVAWTVAPDLARGDKKVARLRRERDVAEGVREACQQAAWRRAADRRDAQRFSDWSARRESADGWTQDDKLSWTGGQA